MNVSVPDIVNNKLCTGCGVCVSESGGTLQMKWDRHGFLVPQQIGSSLQQKAINVCPFNPQPKSDIADEDKLATIFLNNAKNADDKIGRFENTYIGYSHKFRKTSSSGGIATYIFEELLSEKIVDHLFIVKEVCGTYEYQLFDNIDEITKISKTRYIPVTLEKLFEEINTVEGKVAISGVACFIKAIRLKQYYHPELREKIPFLLGIICGGLKSRFFSDFLAQSSGISKKYHDQEYRIKDENSTSSDYSFGAFDKKDTFHQMKMSKVGDMWGTGLFKSNACDFCTDVLTELADISLGDAWLPEYRSEGLGNSVIITRSKLADQLITQGIANKKLRVEIVNKDQIIKSQKSSFTHRQDGIKFRILVAKLMRKQIPYIRKRVLSPISISFAFVQFQRIRTRNKSLVYWEQTKNVFLFNKKMKIELKVLSLLTRINHKLRKK
jgi:coenzyme F420-reducing hydrogenase beta subunit